MYLTVTELERRATIKNVDMSIYTSDELQEYIQLAQNFIEEQTGRIFEQRQVKEHQSWVSGTSLQLKHYPILPPEGQGADTFLIDDLKLDGNTIDWYMCEYENGNIIFDVPIYDWGPWRVNNVDLLYTVTPSYQDPTVLVDLVASKLCWDMVFKEQLLTADGLKMNRVKDSDVQIEYAEVDWVMQRIADLQRPMVMTF
jgi:hypothetical protein